MHVYVLLCRAYLSMQVRGKNNQRERFEWMRAQSEGVGERAESPHRQVREDDWEAKVWVSQPELRCSMQELRCSITGEGIPPQRSEGVRDLFVHEENIGSLIQKRWMPAIPEEAAGTASGYRCSWFGMAFSPGSKGNKEWFQGRKWARAQTGISRWDESEENSWSRLHLRKKQVAQW